MNPRECRKTNEGIAVMNSINASAAGRFTIGESTINRLGYGAMRITGRGVWGPPPDRQAALATLRRLPEIGVNFIDTADSYGPDISEELIREALHPYDGLLIATKAGLTRPGPSRWEPNGHPDYLISQAKGSLRKLGVKQIALWQLHRIDPKVPRDEQFGAIRELLDDGIVRHAGLSEVSVADIEAARQVFPVATVQNRYNLVDRGREDVLAYCAANNIGFIPWFPLAAGELIRPGGRVDRIASGASVVGDDHPLLAEHAVDKRGLADVRISEDRDLQHWLSMPAAGVASG